MSRIDELIAEPCPGNAEFAEIAQIVARQAQLREQINAIVADLKAEPGVTMP